MKYLVGAAAICIILFTANHFYRQYQADAEQARRAEAEGQILIDTLKAERDECIKYMESGGITDRYRAECISKFPSLEKK